MEVDPLGACVAGLQRAGWHVAPQASLWNVTTEIHADRWWSPNLVDTALVSGMTGQGLGQRVQVRFLPEDSGAPDHQVLASTGVVDVAELVDLLTQWPHPFEDAQA